MFYNKEERIGVYAIAKIFTEEFKWIFREQSINDFGIDGFIEITRYSGNLKNLIPTGKLIGVQIKSGRSFFKEEKDNYVVFRGSKNHLEYWLNHSMPIIIIIYNKDNNTAYWEEVCKSTIITTSKSFKINISKKNILDNKKKEALENISLFKTNYQYKLMQLKTSIDEIKLLISKQLFLYVEIDEIPNSNNYHITLLVTDEDSTNDLKIIHDYDSKNPNRFYYSLCISNRKNLNEAINDILPWCDLYINNNKFSDETLTEIIMKEILGYNTEEFIQDVLKLRKENLLMKLACCFAGIYSFKLELKSNELTYAFLIINEFLNKEPSVRRQLVM